MTTIFQHNNTFNVMSLIVCDSSVKLVAPDLICALCSFTFFFSRFHSNGNLSVIVLKQKATLIYNTITLNSTEVDEFKVDQLCNTVFRQ